MRAAAGPLGRRDGGHRGPVFVAGLRRRERAVPERAGDLPGGVAAAAHLRGQHPPVRGARRVAAGSGPTRGPAAGQRRRSPQDDWPARPLSAPLRSPLVGSGWRGASPPVPRPEGRRRPAVRPGPGSRPWLGSAGRGRRRDLRALRAEVGRQRVTSGVLCLAWLFGTESPLVSPVITLGSLMRLRKEFIVKCSHTAIYFWPCRHLMPRDR